MNLQRLNELYSRQANASSTDAENLQQLCRDYPYFSKPYVVLAKYYFDSGHYRFEDALRQAAMRVRDRKALYEYIHDVRPVLPETKTGEAFQEELSVITEEQPFPEISLTEQKAESKPGLEAFLQEIGEVQDLPEVADAVLITEPEDVHRTEPLPDFVETEQAEPETEAEHEAHFVETLEEIALQASETHTGSDKPLEFEFQRHFNAHEVAAPVDQEDIIGEEIATEFSFSRNPPLAPPMPEDKVPETAEPAETSSAGIEITAEQDDETEEPEADVADAETLDLSLRKYPVYSIETLAHKQPEPEKRQEKPDSFEPSMDFFAWLNHPQHEVETAPPDEHRDQDYEAVNSERPVKSLDIIERFIAVNPQISRPKKEFFNPENMAKRSEVLDLDFVSETLANIYYEQGNYEMALKAYEKLSLQNPAKQAYFASLIEKITQERK